MRALIQAAYAVRRRVVGLLRIRTRGVKVMLFNEQGELLLIRNSYGNRELFVLPGGGIGRREAPEAAAAREVREELGIAVREIALAGIYATDAEGKRDTIHLYRGIADGAPSPVSIEVDEARFVRLDALPATVSPATRRRIDELRGNRSIDDRW